MLGIKLESQSLFLFFFSHSYATVKDNNFKCSNVLKALIALAEVFYFELKSVKTLIWQRRYRAIILAVTQNMKKILTLIWVIMLLSLTDKIAFMPYWALAPEAPKSCWLPAQGRQLAAGWSWSWSSPWAQAHILSVQVGEERTSHSTTDTMQKTGATCPSELNIFQGSCGNLLRPLLESNKMCYISLYMAM